MDLLTNDGGRQSALPPSSVGVRPAHSALTDAAATASAVLAGGRDSPLAVDDRVLQNVMFKLIAFQGWLSRFSDEPVRKSFLAGLFKVHNNTLEMLHSLDCIRSVMLPLPVEVGVPDGVSALSGVSFFSKFLMKSDEEPADIAGNPFPVRMSYRKWAVTLGRFSVSPYWHSVKQSDIPPAVRPKTTARFSEPYPAVSTGILNDDTEPFSNLRLSSNSVSSDIPVVSDQPLESERIYSQAANVRDQFYEEMVGDLDWMDLKPGHKPLPFKQRDSYQNKYELRDRVTGNSPGRPSEAHARQSETYYGKPWKSESVHQMPDDLAGRDYGRPQGAEWYKMISQIRHPKEAVAPRNFDGKDGYSLKDFLTDYESFFAIKYDGSERQKSQLLGGYLGGSARRAYDAMDGSRLIYSVLKRELLDWYKGERSNLRVRSEAEFRKARMGGDDTLKIYALKLERLASQAFPESVADCERQLCRKFRKTVPDRFKQALSDGERNLALHGGHARLSWADMMRLSQAEDRHLRERRDERSSDSETEPECAVWYSRPKMSSEGPSRRSNYDRGIRDRKVSFGRTFQNSSRYSPPPKGEIIRKKASPDNIPQCNWCGRRGHEESACWAKNGACGICGSTSHDRNGCPKFDSSWSGFLPKCSACGGPHLGRNCDQVSN